MCFIFSLFCSGFRISAKLTLDQYIWMNVKIISKCSGFNCNDRKMDVCRNAICALIFIIQHPCTTTVNTIMKQSTFEIMNSNIKYTFLGIFLHFYSDQKTHFVFIQLCNSLLLTSLLLAYIIAVFVLPSDWNSLIYLLFTYHRLPVDA